MTEVIVTLAALSGLTATFLGAVGTHRLRAHHAPEEMDVFTTAVRYHFYHSLAALFSAVMRVMWPYSQAAQWAALFFFAGLILFSGSLYLRVFLRRRALAAPAPLGGVAFMLGWLSLALTPWW